MFQSFSKNNKELNAKLAAISKSQAVIEFRLDGTIVAANENFLNVLGYSPSMRCIRLPSEIPLSTSGTHL